MSDAVRFLEALAGELPEDERLIVCGFSGDPLSVGPSAWKPRPWRPGRDINLGNNDNGYVTVGSFRRAPDGSFRRRNETFAAGLALMVDDVGTKVPAETLMKGGNYLLRPSAIVETSPDNFQWWYLLAEPERDAPRFDGVIRAFISGKLLGADPGMSGITRVGRIPGFRNAKAKYRTDASPEGFRVALAHLDTSLRYSVEDLLKAFDLRINGRRETRVKLVSEEAKNRVEAFKTAYRFLRGRKMFKRTDADLSGWIEMTCPWVDHHTGASDTGAAVRLPATENDYYGAFRCHHGHCNDKGWADLTDWINELAIEELDKAGEQG